MPIHQYITCPTCGATRLLEKFGLAPNGTFAAETAPSYPFRLSTKHTGGGHRGIHWTQDPLPRYVMLALRERMSAELDSLDAGLAESRHLVCAACGQRCEPEPLGIVDRFFVPDQAKMFSMTWLDPIINEHGTSLWKVAGEGLWAARAMLARLEWVAEQLRQATEEEEG